MRIDRGLDQTNKKGIIQVLPLLLLAVFAVVTLVIANRVQTTQEEIRSRAYIPREKTPTPIFRAPTAATTPRPTTCSGFISCASGYHRACHSPPYWSCDKDATAPTPTQPRSYCARTCSGNYYCVPDTSGGHCVQEAVRTTPTAAPQPTAAPARCAYSCVARIECVDGGGTIQSGACSLTGQLCCKFPSTTTTTPAPVAPKLSSPTCYNECLAQGSSPSECKFLPSCSTASTGGGTGCTAEGQCNAYYQKICHYDAVSGKFILTTACVPFAARTPTPASIANLQQSTCDACRTNASFPRSVCDFICGGAAPTPSAPRFDLSISSTGAITGCHESPTGKYSDDTSCFAAILTYPTAYTLDTTEQQCFPYHTTTGGGLTQTECFSRLAAASRNKYRLSITPTSTGELNAGCGGPRDDGQYNTIEDCEKALNEAVAKYPIYYSLDKSTSPPKCVPYHGTAGLTGGECSGRLQSLTVHYALQLNFDTEGGGPVTGRCVVSSTSSLTLAQCQQQLADALKSYNTPTSPTPGPVQYYTFDTTLASQGKYPCIALPIGTKGLTLADCIGGWNQFQAKQPSGPCTCGTYSAGQTTCVNNTTIQTCSCGQQQGVWQPNTCPGNSQCGGTPGSAKCITSTCGSGLNCSGSQLSGATLCAPQTGGQAYCCPSGFTISGNACVPPGQAPSGPPTLIILNPGQLCQSGAHQQCVCNGANIAAGQTCSALAAAPSGCTIGSTTCEYGRLLFCNTERKTVDTGACDVTKHGAAQTCSPGNKQCQDQINYVCAEDGQKWQPQGACPPTAPTATPTPYYTGPCRSGFDPFARDCADCPGGLHHWIGARQFCGAEQPFNPSNLPGVTTTPAPTQPPVGCREDTKQAVQAAKTGGTCALAGEYDCCAFCPSGTKPGEGNTSGQCVPSETAAVSACLGKSVGACTSNNRLCAIFRGTLYESSQPCPTAAPVKLGDGVTCVAGTNVISNLPNCDTCQNGFFPTNAKNGDVATCGPVGSTPPPKNPGGLPNDTDCWSGAIQATTGDQKPLPLCDNCAYGYHGAVYFNGPAKCGPEAPSAGPTEQPAATTTPVPPAGVASGVNCIAQCGIFNLLCIVRTCFGIPVGPAPSATPTPPAAGGAPAAGSCTYYSCSQQLVYTTSGARQLRPGFCATNYPKTNPCKLTGTLAPSQSPTPPVPAGNQAVDGTECFGILGPQAANDTRPDCGTCIHKPTGPAPDGHYYCGGRTITETKESGCCTTNDQCEGWFGKGTVCDNLNGACASGIQCRGAGAPASWQTPVNLCHSNGDASDPLNCIYCSGDAQDHQLGTDNRLYCTNGFVAGKGVTQPQTYTECLKSYSKQYCDELFKLTPFIPPATANECSRTCYDKYSESAARLATCLANCTVTPTPPAAGGGGRTAPTGAQPTAGVPVSGGVPSGGQAPSAPSAPGAQPPPVIPPPLSVPGLCNTNPIRYPVEGTGWCDAKAVRCVYRNGQVTQLSDPWCDIDGTIPANTCIGPDQRSVAAIGCTMSQRTIVPANSTLLTNGKGITNGAAMTDGNFQVEGYCTSKGLGVTNSFTDWSCLNSNGSTNFTLKIADYDAICQKTYNILGAFAIQSGTSSTPAFNWRCFAFGQ